MPIIERTDGRIVGQSGHGREWDDEPGARYLSHSCLEYGDYLGGSSDIQAANMRELPNVLGVKAPPDNEWWLADGIERETGSYGYVRAWIRVDVMPDGWDLFDYEQTAERWEEHVREELSKLDDYPLFDDESLSDLMTEWVDAAWKDYGLADCRREMSHAGADTFSEWLDSQDVHPPGRNADYDPWQAEGGEGGVYFDIHHCCALLALEHFPAFFLTVDPQDAGAELWNLTAMSDKRRGSQGRLDTYLGRLAGWDNRFNLSDPLSYGVMADYLEEHNLAPEWLAPLRSVMLANVAAD